MEIHEIETQIEEIVTTNFELVVVHNDTSLTVAKSNSKFINLRKCEYRDGIAPFKKFTNELHKKIVSVEKSNLTIFDQALYKQREEIGVYKEKLYAIQQEQLRMAQETADRRAEELKEKQRAIAKKESDKLLVEAERLQDAGAADERVAKRLEDESDKLLVEAERLQDAGAADERVAKQLDESDKLLVEAERLLDAGATDGRVERRLDEADRITNIAENFRPEAIPEKIIAKKYIIKEKINYFISDEAGFVEWALMNNRSLLKIEPVLSNFKIWANVRREPEKEFSFVEKSISY